MQDDTVATKWLNDPAVRKAVHAKEVSIQFIIFLSISICNKLMMDIGHHFNILDLFSKRRYRKKRLEIGSYVQATSNIGTTPVA